MNTFKIKRGDLLPVMSATLSDSDGEFDLTNATVVFKFKSTQSTVVKSGNASVIEATKGTVEYAWVAGDTDIPGIYVGEWEVTKSGKVLTFPNTSQFIFEIIPDVG